MPDKVTITIERQNLLGRFLINGECIAEVDGAVNDGWTTRTFHPSLERYNFPIRKNLDEALGKLTRRILIEFAK